MIDKRFHDIDLMLIKCLDNHPDSKSGNEDKGKLPGE